MTIVVLSAVGVVVLILYVLKRRSRLRAEESENY